MSLKVDRVQLEIIINNDQARKQLRELDEEARKLTSEMKKLDKTSVEYAQKAARLKAVKQQMDSIHESIGLTNMTMRELSSRQKDLNAILRNLRPGTEEYRKLKEEVNLVSARMSELRGKSQTTGSSLNGMAGSFRKYIGVISAGVATVSGFVYGIKRAVDMYYEEEKALKKVEQAIKSTGGAAGLSLKQLKQEASDLQDKTIFGDETILNDVTAQLLTFTNVTGSTFLRAQEAAMDLSTVLDGDLKSSSIMLGKALNDPIQGLTALRRVGVAFTVEQREQITTLTKSGKLMDAQALILDELNKQYGGQAQAAAKGAGAIDQMANSISDFGETVGKHVLTVLGPYIKSISTITKSLNNWISIPLSKNLQVEQTRVNALVTALGDKNIALETRNKYYEELKKLAPEVLGNMTAENVSITTLTRNLAAYNEQMVLKIMLQRKEEEIAKLLDDQADAFEKINDVTVKLSTQINKVYGDLVYNGGKAREDAIKLKSEYLAGRISVDEYADSLFNLSEQYKISRGNASAGSFELLNLRSAQDKFNTAQQKALGIEKQKQELMKSLGITSSSTAEILDEDSDNTDKNNKKLKTSYEKLSEAIGEAKKKMLDFIAAGKFPEAKQAGALLKSLELQQKVANKIAEAGGDINKFLTDLTDDTQGLLDEIGEVDAELMNLEWFKKSVEKYKSSESEKETNKQEFRTNIITNEYETTTKKNEDNKFDKDFYLSAIDTASSAAFDIWRSKTDARLEYESAALDKQMEKELSNKNLTEEQKDKIKDKYAKKEAKLKTDAFKKQKAADIIQAIINAALGVTRALSTGGLPGAIIAGIAGAAQIATIVAQPVPQFAKGRYNVIGADDNRLYNAKYTGTPETKIYTSPSLIAEQGSELIVDAKTTRNLMMNYPGIIEAIYAARVPQRASGNMDTVKLPSGSDPALLLAVNRLNENIEKGIKGKWVLYDLEQAQDKLAGIRNESTF